MIYVTLFSILLLLLAGMYIVILSHAADSLRDELHSSEAELYSCKESADRLNTQLAIVSRDKIEVETYANEIHDVVRLFEPVFYAKDDFAERCVLVCASYVYCNLYGETVSVTCTIKRFRFGEPNTEEYEYARFLAEELVEKINEQ